MKSFLVTAVACYAVLVAAVYLLQRRMMYFPDVSRPEFSAYQGERLHEVQLTTADGLTLSAGYRPPAAEGAPVIVYFHGNAGHHGHRAALVQPYLAAGYGALLASYRGYGGNPGAPSEAGLYADAHAALDWLEAQGVAPARIVLFGESLGSGVAVQLAKERHLAGQGVGAIVLQAPFTSTVDVGARHYWYLPVSLLMRDRFDSASKIGEIGTPLLVLYSDSDTVVPPRLSKALFDAAAEPKELREYPQAGHNGFEMSNAPNDVIAFIERHRRPN